MVVAINLVYETALLSFAPFLSRPPFFGTDFAAPCTRLMEIYPRKPIKV